MSENDIEVCTVKSFPKEYKGAIVCVSFPQGHKYFNELFGIDLGFVEPEKKEKVEFT